jgi:hypothetical protein
MGERQYRSAGSLVDDGSGLAALRVTAPEDAAVIDVAHRQRHRAKARAPVTAIRRAIAWNFMKSSFDRGCAARVAAVSVADTFGATP